MTAIVTLVVSILVIGLLIFIHELGHFMAARRVGVTVYEFALGFGPKVVSRTRGRTEYSLRMVPLGGFVRLAGSHPGEEEEEDEGLVPGEALMERSVAERALIFASGSAMNLLLAVVLFTLIFTTLGTSHPTLLIESLEPGLPAEAAGLEPGDRVVSVGGQEVESWGELVLRIQGSLGRPITLTVERDGDLIAVEVVPAPHPEDAAYGVIGVRPEVRVERLGVFGSMIQGVRMTGLVIGGFLDGLVSLARGDGGAEFIGIIGIGQEIGEATRMGLPNLGFLAAVLSASLGLINLLPIPALDGSKLVFLGIEAVRGRPIDPDRENFIHFIGFFLLMALAVLIAYRDIVRLSGGEM